MTMTDPIADMLTRIRNANSAMFDTVKMPGSKLKESLAGIQRRWDKIGKVPREKVKVVEDRLRKVETAVRKLDEDHWQKSDPEKQARSDGLASQLQDAIAKLERELADAEASGDKTKVAKAQEALDARKVWLDAIK